MECILIFYSIPVPSVYNENALTIYLFKIIYHFNIIMIDQSHSQSYYYVTQTTDRSLSVNKLGKGPEWENLMSSCPSTSVSILASRGTEGQTRDVQHKATNQNFR